MQTGAMPGQNSDVIMFDVNVTTCVALFLTNILLVKPFKKSTNPKIAKKALLCYSENINRISH